MRYKFRVSSVFDLSRVHVCPRLCKETRLRERQRVAAHGARKAKGRSRHRAARLLASARRLRNSLKHRAGKSVYPPALLAEYRREHPQAAELWSALLSARRP